MEKEKLLKEHAQLKEQLAELTDFINSEGYYQLPENEKSLIANQRAGMEMTINAMSVRLWGMKTAFGPDLSMMSLLGMMLARPTGGYSNANYSMPDLPLKEEETKKEEL